MLIGRLGAYFSKNYYSILGVSSKATLQDIKGRYYELAKTLHPDVNPTEQAKLRFAEIKQAYEVLSN
jgi:molecular chaperone DnaJ